MRKTVTVRNSERVRKKDIKQRQTDRRANTQTKTGRDTPYHKLRDRETVRHASRKIVRQRERT